MAYSLENILLEYHKPDNRTTSINCQHELHQHAKREKTLTTIAQVFFGFVHQILGYNAPNWFC